VSSLNIKLGPTHDDHSCHINCGCGDGKQGERKRGRAGMNECAHEKLLDEGLKLLVV
jgi:hypothetical protein